jgi:1,4-alpha-glucan branching enzyme
VLNYTPVARNDYRVGVSHPGVWLERVNTDASDYGGGGIGNMGRVTATDHWSHNRPHSLFLRVPPLAAVFLTPEKQPEPPPPPAPKPATPPTKTDPPSR